MLVFVFASHSLFTWTTLVHTRLYPWLFFEGGYIKSHSLLVNPMRTTCRLVKMNILALFEPITEGVRKNTLICKFMVQYFQRLDIIGRTSEHSWYEPFRNGVKRPVVPRGLIYWCQLKISLARATASSAFVWNRSDCNLTSSIFPSNFPFISLQSERHLFLDGQIKEPHACASCMIVFANGQQLTSHMKTMRHEEVIKNRDFIETPLKHEKKDEGLVSIEIKRHSVIQASSFYGSNRFPRKTKW